MKRSIYPTISMLLFVLLISFASSCQKDTDLLLDTVLYEDEIAEVVLLARGGNGPDPNTNKNADDDGDGVSNDLDDCPFTPLGAKVNEQGCAASQYDTDKDGIVDNQDQCPGTPAGSSVDASGCASSQKTNETPSDNDQDGVANEDDLCPNTPAGASVNKHGCTNAQWATIADDDEDGVTNEKDECPDTPSGESVNGQGCSDSQLDPISDDDNDGVPNEQDDCPYTPAGATVNNFGCAASQYDTDGDGVNDSLDECPNTATGQNVDENGCSQGSNFEPNFSGVPLESFGAIGDGIADDTRAIQAAFDSGNDFYFTPDKTYKITSLITIDKNGDQLVSGNGASILIGVELSNCLMLEKSIGQLHLNNLNIDGNNKGEWIFQLKSSFKLDGVNIKNVYSDDQAAIGFNISIRKNGNWSNLELLNCTVDNVIADGNGVIGDNKGAARALVYDYISTPSDLNGIIENCEFSNVFAEDGDVFHFRSFDQNWDAESNLTIKNSKFETATRRVAKIFAGNINFQNCTFTHISRSHPNFNYALETGGFISLGNTAGDVPAKRVIFDNCVFNGSDYDNRIIQSKSTDISIKNSTWNNGTEFRMWRFGGGVCIQNNRVSSGSKVYTAALNTWYGPMIVEGNINTPENFKEYLSNNPPSPTDYTCPE